MKHIITILAAVVLLGTNIHAQEATAKWIDSITVAPVAVLQSEGINGTSTFGTGLDLGIGINKYVSIHGAAYGFETDAWRGGVVDEAEIYGKAKFASFYKQALTLTGKGGAVYDPAGEDYAIAVGAGLDLAINETWTLGADYSIRAWFNGREKDSLLRGFVQLSF